MINTEDLMCLWEKVGNVEHAIQVENDELQFHRIMLYNSCYMKCFHEIIATFASLPSKCMQLFFIIAQLLRCKGFFTGSHFSNELSETCMYFIMGPDYAHAILVRPN